MKEIAWDVVVMLTALAMFIGAWLWSLGLL
jgi:hypothetical protein